VRYDVGQVDPQTRQATLWVTLASGSVWSPNCCRVVLDPLATAQAAASQAAIQTAGIPGYSCYRTVEESHASLRALPSSSDAGPVRRSGKAGRTAASTGEQGYELRGVVRTNRARPGPKPVFLLIGATPRPRIHDR
jgi:hypothetical protein